MDLESLNSEKFEAINVKAMASVIGGKIKAKGEINIDIEGRGTYHSSGEETDGRGTSHWIPALGS